MKKVFILFIIMACILMSLSSCRPLPSPPEEEDLQEYTEEVLPIAKEADFEAWIEKVSNRQDLSQIKNYADKIQSVNSRYWEKGSEGKTQFLKEWGGPEKNSLKDWKKEAREFAYAAWFMRKYSNELAEKVDDVSQKDGVINNQETKEIKEALKYADAATKNLIYEFKTWKGSFRLPFGIM